MSTRLACAGLLICAIASSAMAQDAPRTIDVQGSSSVTVPAEYVELTLNLRSTGDSLAKVKERNDLLAQQILDFAKRQTLVAAVVREADISIRFEPSDAERGGSDKKKQQETLVPQLNSPPASGKDGGNLFEAADSPTPIVLRREVELRFANLEQVWPALTEFTSWDAVRKAREITISSPRYGVKNEEAVRQQARRRAVASAEETAQVLADSAGLVLGAALHITDRSAGGRDPYLPGRLADPFGASLPRTENAGVAFVALQEPAEKEAHVGSVNDPPQITISASVQIKYEVRIPK